MIKEVFNDMVRAAKAIADNLDDINYGFYVSGSKAKKTKLEKMLKKYIEDSDLDYELGIISHDEHFKEMTIAKILENSLKNYVIY